MNAITLLEPMFQWWERFSEANPGIGFMTFIYGAVLLLVWMFSRYQPARVATDHTFIIVVRDGVRAPPLPPAIRRRLDLFPPEDEDDESDSFSA